MVPPVLTRVLLVSLLSGMLLIFGMGTNLRAAMEAVEPRIVVREDILRKHLLASQLALELSRFITCRGLLHSFSTTQHILAPGRSTLQGGQAV